MIQVQFSRKTRQLNRLVQKLKIALKNEANSTGQIHILKVKIGNLVRNLKGVISGQQLKRILGSFAVFFGLGISTNSNAQYFLPPVQNPFGINTNIGGLSGIETADLDGDGDFDIIQGGYYGVFDYFENTGTLASPAFAAPVQNPFGLVATYYYGFPTSTDLDNDGDIDLLVGEYYGNMQYFENTGTVNSPAFAAPVLNPFGINQVVDYAWPVFTDLDGDGDFDLMVGEYGGSIQYFENTGTINSPSFAAAVMNPFGLTSVYTAAFPELADLDADGDLDLLVGEYLGTFQYFENTGTVNSPAFATPVLNPFSLVATYALAFPDLVDLDDDGDFDLLVCEYYATIQYFENLNCSPSYGTDTQTAFDTFDWIDGNTYTTSNNTATFNIVGGSVSGCDSIVTLNLTIISTINIDESNLLSHVTLFPNPTEGGVTIFLGDLNSVSLKLSSIDGKVIYQQNNITGPTHQFDFDEASGIYIVEIISEGEKRVFKLVKK